jgi:hypothetical protein
MLSQFVFVKHHAAFPILTFVRSGSAIIQLDTCYFFPHSWKIENTSNLTELVELTYLLTYNLASLSGPNSARARTHLTLSLMKQFRSNLLTLH